MLGLVSDFRNSASYAVPPLVSTAANGGNAGCNRSNVISPLDVGLGPVVLVPIGLAVGFCAVVRKADQGQKEHCLRHGFLKQLVNMGAFGHGDFMPDAPRLFISYSHDNQAHKDWVLKLSTRLVGNGVNVILDQWDMTLGGDLPRFMELGLVEADRVLAICSASYVDKANHGHGGTGYEKMILTGQLMNNIGSDRIIPVIRNNTTDSLQPTFLTSRLYADFRDDAAYEAKYAELLRNIHGQAVTSRPQLGLNPFVEDVPDVEPRIEYSPTRYISPSMSGVVTFDYSNNSGRYVLGSGDMLFETAWSRADSTSVHVYSDPPSIRSLALATGILKISEIKDARFFDTSSRARNPQLNESIVWQNTAGYFLATQVLAVKSRGHGNLGDEITFRYLIKPNKGFDFTGP